jgi:hypothetical protein
MTLTGWLATSPPPSTPSRDRPRSRPLYKRFQTLQSAAIEYTQLLDTSLDDTGAALQPVRARLTCLLATVG